MPATNAPGTCSEVHESTVARLLNLHDGEAGVMTLVDYGPAAIPALRSFLFRRDRSGIYQPRRWAVDALAALKAYDILADYLRATQPAKDPVERLGDEAVINAAARALSKVREEWVFQLLLSQVRKHLYPGVVDAVGSFDLPEAVPHLIDALAEDDCRSIAEAHLGRVAPAAQALLLNAAARRCPSAANESETSLRQRRSALRIVSDTALPASTWPQVKALISDSDMAIAVLACKLWLRLAPAPERHVAVYRLNALRGRADFLLAEDIDTCLSNLQEDRSHA